MTTEDLKGAAQEAFDTGKDAVVTARERFKNPFIGSLIISSIFLLWKPILVLIFSNKAIEERIIYIKDTFQYEWWHIFIPVAIAVAYVLGVPYIMWGIGKLLKFANKGISEENREEKKVELVADIEFQKLKKELTSSENINKEIDNLNKEIENRQLQIKNLNEMNEKLQDEVKIRLAKEQKLEIERLEQTQNLEILRNELNLLKNEPKIKLSEVKKEYVIFQNSELHKFMPDISEWLTNGKGEITDDEVASSSHIEMVGKYQEAGLIQNKSGTGRGYEFTEKGKIFNNIFRGIEAVTQSKNIFHDKIDTDRKTI